MGELYSEHKPLLKQSKFKVFAGILLSVSLVVIDCSGGTRGTCLHLDNTVLLNSPLPRSLVSGGITRLTTDSSVMAAAH